MGVTIPLTALPTALTPFEAVEAAYPAELTRCVEAIAGGLPLLIECDKGLAPYLWRCVRDRLKPLGIASVYLSGRPAGAPAPVATGVVATVIEQLREAVRGAAEPQVIVLPHLDLLTSHAGSPTSEAREVIPLLYENPALVWVGFKDPSMPLPRVIEALFPRRVSILGIGRDRLRHVITQREARKFGAELNPYALYTHISGQHAARLRRILPAVTGEDLPADPRPAYAQLRSATQPGDAALPDIDLERDIGGYTAVKARLQTEILDLLRVRATLDDADAIARIEQLIPRGLIFWGPPGTGKTLFAKAMATALGAAVTIVSGPELKSRWVGESEERIRQLFLQARQAAPAVLVFDELDSFATARGTYTGSGVEHSMVNQLLTEMDGFRRNEMVFVVGTTNLPESLDPALLRPGRFEFLLHVPYPDADDRRAILRVHDRQLGLALTDAALEHAVRRTAGPIEGGTGRYSGDHLQALARGLARTRVREGRTGPTDIDAVERALTAHLDPPALSPAEERVVATHEAGHAICALHCAHAPPIERISIRGDLSGALGFVQYGDAAHRYITTRSQLLDHLCVLFGGREAELLLLDDLSLGSGQDYERATDIARTLVERLALGGDPRVWPEVPTASERTREQLEERVAGVLAEQRDRARQLVHAHRAEVEALRDLLLERKVLDRASLTQLARPRS